MSVASLPKVDSDIPSMDAMPIVQREERSTKRISRDEMNLAEFPLAVLSTRVNPKLKTLEFSDNIRDKNGKAVTRNWVITGADKFGLPTSSDDEVLLGLLKLTVDEGFTTQKVYFTRYELLKILRWSTEGRSYTRLQNAFDRLTGVRVKATNAFFDNQNKKHSTKNFGIIDAYEINDGREVDTKPSYFIWSEELLNSFQAGYVKKLDLDFFLDLKSAVSKRLYRFLDKLFWYKVEVSFDLFTLCHEKLGISRNYKYASSLRQQLDPAVQELCERGFLSHCEYAGRGKGTEVTFRAGRKKPRSVDGKEGSIQKSEAQSPPREPMNKQALDRGGKNSSMKQTETFLNEEQGAASGAEGLYGKIANALIARGLKEHIVESSLEGNDAAALNRIARIIKHIDERVATDGMKIENPEGFLFWAINNPAQYSLPDEGRIKQNAPPRERALAPESARDNAAIKEALYKEYLDARSQEIARALENVEDSMLLNIRKEAEK